MTSCAFGLLWNFGFSPFWKGERKPRYNEAGRLRNACRNTLGNPKKSFELSSLGVLDKSSQAGELLWVPWKFHGSLMITCGSFIHSLST